MRLTHKKTGANDLVELYEYDYDHIGHKTKFRHHKDGISQTVASYNQDDLGRLSLKNIKPIYQIGSICTCPWLKAESWSLGRIPTQNDNVIINIGTDITIATGTIANAGKLIFKGGILRNYGKLNLGNFGSKLPPNSPSFLADPIISTLQGIDYKYQIRGNLLGVNLDANNNTALANGDLFSMKLGYETEGFFDGNIGKQEWKTSLDNVSRSFTYGYDGANRIISGTYAGTGSENYSLNFVTYDKNGGITALSRNGYKSNNTFGLIDNLAYTYNANSNKILKVDDLANETASFRDIAGNDYTYSLDGSLTSDANKGITVMEYNYLKKPRRVVQNGVTTLYQYDAGGNKLKETIGTQVTDYVGNKIYKNNGLYQIAHDEGRIVDGEYEYNIKDHLGNLRVAFRDSLGIARIMQANSYGIWGEDLPTLNYLSSTWKADNFKFTGKENLQGTGFIDFGARWYDNLVPRFTTIDALAEKYYDLSSYNYVANNPINSIDPDGKEIFFLVRNDDGSVREQLRYRSGDFWHSDGRRYNPGEENLSEILYTVLSAYRRIENSDNDELKGILSQLVSSKNIHYIEGGGQDAANEVHGQMRLEIDESDSKKFKQVLDHTQTVFNFKGKVGPDFKGIGKAPFTTVVHEMRHQYDYDISNMGDNTGVNDQKNPAEIRAVYLENIARSMIHLQNRTKYDGVIDPKLLKSPSNNKMPQKK
jgi:RHS repeat-associated protein